MLEINFIKQTSGPFLTGRVPKDLVLFITQRWHTFYKKGPERKQSYKAVPTSWIRCEVPSRYQIDNMIRKYVICVYDI
jgi:hypothetical protein